MYVHTHNYIQAHHVNTTAKKERLADPAESIRGHWDSNKQNSKENKIDGKIHTAQTLTKKCLTKHTLLGEERTKAHQL